MITTIARYAHVGYCNRFTPKEFHFHQYPDGRIRFHKRGRNHCIDQWFNSFDQIIPILEWLTNSDKYELDNQRRYHVPDIYENLLFSDLPGDIEHNYKDKHTCPF